MLTQAQISALAVAPAGAELHNLWRQQEEMWLESQPGCLSFPQLQDRHLQLLLVQRLEDQKLLKKAST